MGLSCPVVESDVPGTAVGGTSSGESAVAGPPVGRKLTIIWNSENN